MVGLLPDMMLHYEQIEEVSISYYITKYYKNNNDNMLRNNININYNFYYLIDKLRNPNQKLII